MTHAFVRLDLDVVAAPNELPLWEIDSMALYDLFRQGLRLLLLDWDVCKREFRLLRMWDCGCSVGGCRAYGMAM